MPTPRSACGLPADREEPSAHPGACRWRLHRLFATREARFAAGAGREDPLACFLPDHRWIW